MKTLGMLLLALLGAAPAAAQDAQAIIGRAARVYRSLSSLQADFVQVIDNPMIDSAESQGTLAQAGPYRCPAGVPVAAGRGTLHECGS